MVEREAVTSAQSPLWHVWHSELQLMRKPPVNDQCCIVAAYSALKVGKKLKAGEERHILRLSRSRACQPMTDYKWGGAACVLEHHCLAVCVCVGVGVCLCQSTCG